MNTTIQYQRFGGPDVLEMADNPVVDPGPEEVRLRVQAVGLNPIDAKSFDELLPLRLAETARVLAHPDRWLGRGPARFPRVVGRDFAGAIEAIGPDVHDFAVGDAVLGTLRSAPGTGSTRESLTQHLVAPASEVTSRPEGLDVVTAAALGVAAQTACGALRRLRVHHSDLLLISAAAGGVGSIATQLAILQDATVIGIVGASSVEALHQWGAVPVTHDGDVRAQICAAASGPVTKVLDCYGGYTRLARALGVRRPNIATLVPTPLALMAGATFTGSRDARPGDLKKAAALVTSGAVNLSVSQTCPFTLDAVRHAYTQIQQGTARGKIVVTLT